MVRPPSADDVVCKFLRRESKMRNTKLFRLLAVLFAVSLFAAACGSSDTGDAGAADADTSDDAGAVSYTHLTLPTIYSV